MSIDRSPYRKVGRFLAIAAGIAAIAATLAMMVGPTASGSHGAVEAQSTSQGGPARAEASQPARADAVARKPNHVDQSAELPSVDALSRAFATVTKELEPAVVNIFTEQSGQAFHPPTGSPFDDLFERFFRDQPQQPRRSLGSGVIVDPRGYVITNNHVIENAEEIEVQFSDERRFPAEVVGTDAPTDLAVIRIKADGESFPYVTFGDSDALVVGEWVLAMGNPFGFGHTVTAGIVSAKGRLIGQGSYDDFIQTDAAINPGNSGGPLVNMKAEIVGINSNIISNSGGNMGIGFAIPSNMTKNVYEQLVSDGTVTRGWLGVSIQPLTPELATSFGLAGKHGALVAEVLGDDAPAAKAGLQAGDVIVSFNGKPVQSNTHLVRLVADVRPGETAAIEYYRDGELRTTSVTVAKRTIDTDVPAAPPELQQEKGRLGISGQNLTPQLAAEAGASSKSGVILVGIDPEGPAQDAGLRQGDIIIEANREPVRSVDDLQRIIADVPAGGGLLLRIERVNRGGQSSFLFFSVELE